MQIVTSRSFLAARSQTLDMGGYRDEDAAQRAAKHCAVVSERVCRDPDWGVSFLTTAPDGSPVKVWS